MISASIVTFKTKHNELRRIIECAINSLIDYVYIIDNSPTDDLRTIVSEFDSNKLEYIFGQGNIGFGSANNIGIRKGLDKGAEFHIILNPDIIFSSEAFKSMKLFMDRNTDVGMMAPKLIYPDGRPQVTAMMLPSPMDMFGRRLLPKFFQDIVNEHYELRSCDLSKSRSIPNICGCFMFIRCSVLEKAGLFDERFFMYFEDFDLVRRVHKYSKIAYFADATIIHAHAAEHRTNKFLLIESIKSAIQYFNKWGWFIDLERRKWNKEALLPSSIIV